MKTKENEHETHPDICGALSARAGITRQWLAEIESPAKVSMPSVDTLLCIADALEIPPAKLFEFKEIEA